jgi:hypothetical protein
MRSLWEGTVRRSRNVFTTKLLNFASISQFFIQILCRVLLVSSRRALRVYPYSIIEPDTCPESAGPVSTWQMLDKEAAEEASLTWTQQFKQVQATPLLKRSHSAGSTSRHSQFHEQNLRTIIYLCRLIELILCVCSESCTD